MKTVRYGGLTEIQKKLVTEAEKVLKNAYSPYSKFCVGAAILTDNNKIVTGTNVENAAYGETICAERAAVARANAMGYRRFKSIAIIAHGEKKGDIITPCGSCRQVLSEFSQFTGCDIEMIMCSGDKKKIVIGTVSELLPLAFKIEIRDEEKYVKKN